MKLPIALRVNRNWLPDAPSSGQRRDLLPGYGNAPGIDLADAVCEKVGLNAQKYPAAEYRGRYKIGE